MRATISLRSSDAWNKQEEQEIGVWKEQGKGKVDTRMNLRNSQDLCVEKFKIYI